MKVFWSVIVIVIGYVAYRWFAGHEDTFDFRNLAGKNVLVTGASSGIGKRIAIVCAQHGANVVITARREPLLKQVVQKCQEVAPGHAKISYMTADMGNMEQVKGMLQEAINVLEGRLDLLFLNHGIIPEWTDWHGSQDNLTLHDKILDVNYRSYVHLASYALPALITSNGSIGVVGSISGKMPTTRALGYSAAKFALDSFFSGLGWELSIRNVNVSATYCTIGVVDTEQANTMFSNHFKRNHVHQGRFQALLPAANVTETAQAIVKATYTRQKELYFPSNQNLFLTALLRVAAPTMFEKQLESINLLPGEQNI